MPTIQYYHSTVRNRKPTALYQWAAKLMAKSLLSFHYFYVHIPLSNTGMWIQVRQSRQLCHSNSRIYSSTFALCLLVTTTKLFFLYDVIWMVFCSVEPQQQQKQKWLIWERQYLLLNPKEYFLVSSLYQIKRREKYKWILNKEYQLFFLQIISKNVTYILS